MTLFFVDAFARFFVGDGNSDFAFILHKPRLVHFFNEISCRLVDIFADKVFLIKQNHAVLVHAFLRGNDVLSRHVEPYGRIDVDKHDVVRSVRNAGVFPGFFGLGRFCDNRRKHRNHRDKRNGQDCRRPLESV